jgi:glucuronoxylan 4-O-methyltransferase
VIRPALTGQILRLARLAVRFGSKPGLGEFKRGPLGHIGRFGNGLLVRHRHWERRFIAGQLQDWRKTRSLGPLRRLAHGLNIQMHAQELNHILSVLELKRPCALVVFGLGNDSILWSEANPGGRTLFIEDDAYWDRVIRERHPSLRSALVRYDTQASDWREDVARAPALELPTPVGDHAWDIVLVDGPAAYAPEKPGRVQSVLAARQLVADTGTILVHDCDRHAERAICAELLGHMALAGQVQTLRHYIHWPGARSEERHAQARLHVAGGREAVALQAAAGTRT